MLFVPILQSNEFERKKLVVAWWAFQHALCKKKKYHFLINKKYIYELLLWSDFIWCILNRFDVIRLMDNVLTYTNSWIFHSLVFLSLSLPFFFPPFWPFPYLTLQRFHPSPSLHPLLTGIRRRIASRGREKW